MNQLDAPVEGGPIRQAPIVGAALRRLRISARATFATPLGDLLLACSPTGLAGAWFEGQRHHPGHLDVAPDPAHPLLRRAADQLQRYFGGASTTFDIPLDLQGTAFQCAVWQALLGIGVGTTSSYAAIARQLGADRAVRAVGGAIGRNPVSVIVPCHRVVGSDGSLTGYAGGTHRKQALLALEGVTPAVSRRGVRTPRAM